MGHSFFAMLSRMKYIERWALMRNSDSENISEHSLEVAMIAHSLAVIGSVRLHRCVNADRAALYGLYHDCTEIITGDMPTPVKYFNRDIRDAFQRIEQSAAGRMLETLPEDLREAYIPVFFRQEEDAYLWRLVKAADKLSALIKCISEEKAGNREFINAKQTIKEALDEMDMEEIRIFQKEFLGAYYKTLDELQNS